MDSDARVGRHGTNESRHRADWVVPWALLVAALLALLRQEGASSWTTVWAEDGWVYFQQAHDDGLGAVFRGFAGYLQLPTRLFALPAPLLPIDGLGLYLSIVAASVTAMLAWFMYWATGGWIADRPAAVRPRRPYRAHACPRP